MTLPLTKTRGEELPYSVEEYEEAIKTLDAAQKVLKDYAKPLRLENKIEFHKVITLLEEARRNMRLNIYEHEDALENGTEENGDYILPPNAYKIAEAVL